jgi:hypothetical protein
VACVNLACALSSLLSLLDDFKFAALADRAAVPALGMNRIRDEPNAWQGCESNFDTCSIHRSEALLAMPVGIGKEATRMMSRDLKWKAGLAAEPKCRQPRRHPRNRSDWR